MKLTAYQLYLLYNGGNPANKITNFISHGRHYNCGRPNLWAAELISKLINENSLIYLHEEGVGIWAATETLNAGSYQRNELPEEIKKHLIGSGRWMAGDCGGHYKQLKEKTIEWLLLDDDTKTQWKALAATKQIWPEEFMNYAINSRNHVEKKRRSDNGEVILNTSSYLVTHNDETSEVFIHARKRTDDKSNSIMCVRIGETFDFNELYNNDLLFQNIDDMSDELDNNNSIIEIDYHGATWEHGPWYFKLRSH